MRPRPVASYSVLLAQIANHDGGVVRHVAGGHARLFGANVLVFQHGPGWQAACNRAERPVAIRAPP